MNYDGRFFIVSLPRSRTAWLSNFLTAGDAFCWHELTARVHSREEFYTAMNTPEDFLGNADSANLLIYNHIVAEFPFARFVVIERDPEEVLESFQKAGLPTDRDLAYWWYAKLRQTPSMDNVLKLQFSDLDESGCKALWDFCLPNMPFDYRRYRMLSEFNVEGKPDYMKHASEYARWVWEK